MPLRMLQGLALKGRIWRNYNRKIELDYLYRIGAWLYFFHKLFCGLNIYRNIAIYYYK
jgi:hypothetical protein